MATRGPRPTPSLIKRLQSTDQPCRMNPDEPPAIPGVPDPPDFLNAEALAEWNRIAPELLRRGLLEPIDRALLTLYCTSWSRVVQAERALRIEGPVLVDVNGRVRVSPYVKILDAASAELTKTCREFGLSPSSRTTVRAAPRAVDSARSATAEYFFGPRR